jgi:predicted nucleic acid-binding protein
MTALADTSIFIAREAGRPLKAQPPDDVAVSVVTVGELRLGVLMAKDSQTRHRRLSTLEVALLLDALPIDERVADAWAGLVACLREAGRRMPINDSWLAATALVHNMPIVTQDADFLDVPGLEVIRL